MYALIETGGKQYRVAEGDVIRVEKLNASVGSEVNLDKVLLVKKDDNSVEVGTPTIQGATVQAEVIAQGKAPKIIVYKYKAKKNERKKKGHRQPYTELKINKINY
ncbi:50S ribosomal protein L21 [Calorimonas adulescens]|uniref:Large ribosomal subunit protein bL21 n=1 Tax=Calorimonas adulescens TaxID=2606906 RepID=A0A5D8QBX2_9THEO|nr:50S ribosomal protein L21 [Calorimonas adulescens]TZE82235.1 50S ribosomal protein L21 [Calorimonas adulescens]